MVFTKAMPSGNDSDSSSSSGTKRTTFRPPWVKEGPDPLPAPPAPWTLKTARRNSKKEEEKPENPLAGVQLRKTTVATKEPQENGKEREVTFKRPQLKPVPQKEEAPPKKENKLPEIKLLKPVPPKDETPQKKENKLPETVKLRKPPPIQRMSTDRDEDREIDRAAPALRNALVREESMRNIRRASQTLAPAPPPMPPPAPKMPGLIDTRPLSEKQAERLEQLKSRPKNRPDWTAMLKEIEGNKKLKHVECNDRSQPLLPQTKATEHFVFESEKPNVHNELLRQIEGGIKLKSVKTNDRSKPVLEGLRKIRRQMTIEEQIQKSISMASIAPEEVITDEADEMDDIDKVRDDLQSTKQMLALELRNKEAQERENKRLLARIQNLEAELEKERSTSKDSSGGKGNGTDADDKIIKTLKQEAEQARKTSQEVEKKFQQTAEQLDSAKQELEEAKKQNQLLEKRLQEALSGKRQSLSKDGALMNGQEIEDDLAIESEEDESDGEDTPEKKERRLQREVKHLRNKLRNFKNKEDNAKKERLALKDILKKHQKAMKEEKKKFKALQKEVDKMAALMKDTEEDEDDEEKEESEEEEEEEEEESSESESEESESEEETEDESESEDEDAPLEKKKTNLESRCNRHEKVLAALKKGNYTMKTNAERLQDDLNKQKVLTEGLQADLDSVLSELG